MRIGHLLDSQVRELREAVLASGLGEQFGWEERSGDWAGYISGDPLPTLVFKPDNFFFAFEYHEAFSDQFGYSHDPGGHQVFFAPGREAPNEVRRHLKWPQVASAFREWLRYVAREKGIVTSDPALLPGTAKSRPRRMPNQFYSSRSGQIITVTPIGEPDRAVRKAGPVSAVDFSFDVVMNAGEPQRVRVAVATEVLTDLEPWSAKPASLDVIGRGGTANELATDLCIARILEAIDKGIDFDEDFERFPDSFLVIRELSGPTSKIATIQMDEDIKDYISRRLYAARRACREVHHPERCAQLFERPDWFYLKVGQPDFLRVIRECMDQRWTKPFREEEYYLLWTDSLIQVMREAERDAATVGSPAQADQLAVAAPARRGR